MMNKTTLIGIVSFFVIGLLVGAQLRGCGGVGVGGGKVGLLRSDTVLRWLPRVDTQWHRIELTNNVPYTVWGHDTVYVKRVERVAGRDTAWLLQYTALTDTVAYADTLREKDAFKAELFDTLYNNRIIGRSLKWANLAPVARQIITNTMVQKPPLVKVYAGAEAYGGKGSFDIAPAASLVFSDRYMVDLGYYIFNREVTAGVKVKLSFRK